VTAATTTERSAVHVGRFAVVSTDAGFVLTEAPRAEERESRELRDALASAEAPSVLGRAEERVSHLEDLTAELERGGRVVSQLTEGLDPEFVARELDGLLDSFRERCQQGRVRDAVRLAEVLAAAYVLARRWIALVEILRDTLAVARAAGDLRTEAWASESLGTLAAAANAPGARELLGHAEALYRQLGDHAGTELASQNLAAAAHGAPASFGAKAAAWVALHKVVVAAIGVAVAATAAGVTAVRPWWPPEPSPPKTVARPVDFTTFDGFRYELNAIGDFVLTRTGDRALEIQVRLAPAGKGDEQHPVFEAVGARVGDQRIVMRAGERPLVRVDGQQAILSDGVRRLSGGGRIERSADRVDVLWADEAKLTVDGSDPASLKVHVEVPNASSRDLEGLLGNANGDAGDDLRTDAGTVVATPAADGADRRRVYTEFAGSWQVAAEDSLFR
jgi:von Willebrand factor type D domain